ncbi:hypothetical protein A2852_01270 [Candidatus Adlerbacteria bacterium RIFCSPHIGHO2_01_FULL_54_23]|uniref:Lactate dehydrogenase n=3 Tax=Candidatus Adleribacteriota TaxID=1752736 RepID=A0A1F4Y0D9_9BACT|nr:MAG: Lactate dehydrogenase-like protein [Candidatus Adlerbacteria bacterium GW2011_GWA1_54_10]KKW36371.1 MAG: Lactate dehydrogenase-like protein [Candidatus Adlerbacteria bacterium GW2011_GWA2_54_12]OGC79241.1 MAG: hypothetical protein A2852_01270 [Candidatus Adlerbacteria bacterium RIFCSPHIGHO2_01_FULL_54_23]OGC87351.1 MAG: hypothetical protein A3B33_00160 [Candidatus Adlerbacteria bacterium RIFCSPLOWO2_01_FULL_54_16]
MTKLLYVYEERIPEDLRALVCSYFPAEEFLIKEMTYRTPPEEQKKMLSWTEVVLFAPGRYLPDEILETAKNVKLIQLWSSGYDKFNVAACKKLGIQVANNGGANAGSVAEHAILLMLAVYKWLPDSHRRTVEGMWVGNKHGLDMHMLTGKKVGIIGFGNIGRAVAKKLLGFETDTVYYDIKRADTDIERALNARFAPFEELLGSADIVTLHLHSTKETQNIIGARELSIMRPQSILINVARAQLVDQNALTDALKNKKIHGVGLDVYLKEPTEPNDPLLMLPNVVATPHMAGSTLDAYDKALKNARENFRRVARGEQPLWVVDC